jgi:hypothetical protein
VHTKDDLINLDRFQAIVKMQTAGKTLPAFSLSTPPPLEKSDDAKQTVERIRDLSREKYARPFEEVETEFVERFQDERLRLAKESAAEGSYLG